jgi:hypothetical protein
VTDDEIRDVFAELHRIGVDLGKPPGLAIGIGFRESELLPWLRALPDGLGHDEFVALSTAYVNAAEPDLPELPTRADGRPHRMWPTVEQLHAAADILAREWDPLGARLGNLSRDDLTEHVSTALQIALGGQSRELIERQISRYLASVEQDAFGLRPSPAEQRRYLARRLMRVIVDMPGSPHEGTLFDDVRSEVTPVARSRANGERSRSVAMARPRQQVVGLGPRPTDPAPLDPAASCSACGAVGTVAVVVREVEPLVSRFCPSCWARAREVYWMPIWNRPTPPLDRDTPEGQIATLEWIHSRMTEASRHDARYVASAMWEDRLPFLEAALAQTESQSPAEKDRHIRKLAHDLVSRAPHMYGPMPPAIEAFVRQYRSAAVQPAPAGDKHEPPATSPERDA